MSKHWILIGPIDDVPEDPIDGMTAEDRKELLEDAGWKNVTILRGDERDNEIKQLRAELAKMREREKEQYRGWSKWFREQPKIETTTGTQSADGTINLDLHMIKAATVKRSLPVGMQELEDLETSVEASESKPE